MAAVSRLAHESKSLATGATATLSIPTGGKIQEMQLHFTTSAGATVTEAQVRAEIGNIRLTLDGKDVINCAAEKLYDLYEYLGVNVGVAGGIGGVLELALGKLTFADPVARDLFGIGTDDIQNIQVQITCGTLSAIANVQAFTARQSVKEKLGTYFKYINYPQSFNATGNHTVDTLPRDPDSSYFAVLVDDGASGTITKGECRVDNYNVVDGQFPSAVNQVGLSNNGFVQPAGYFVYNFADRSLSGRVPMLEVNDLRFIQTFSVAAGAGGYNMTVLSAERLPVK